MTETECTDPDCNDEVTHEFRKEPDDDWIPVCEHHAEKMYWFGYESRQKDEMEP